RCRRSHLVSVVQTIHHARLLRLHRERTALAVHQEGKGAAGTGPFRLTRAGGGTAPRPGQRSRLGICSSRYWWPRGRIAPRPPVTQRPISRAFNSIMCDAPSTSEGSKLRTANHESV